MKKRILALLLSCLLLSGCGGQQLSNAVSGGLNNPKKPSAPTAPAAETEKPAPKPEEPAGAGTEGAEPSSEPQTEASVGVEQEQSSVLEQLPPKIVISRSRTFRYSHSTVNARPNAACHSYFLGNCCVTAISITAKSEIRNSEAMMIKITEMTIDMTILPMIVCTISLVKGIKYAIVVRIEIDTALIISVSITILNFLVTLITPVV